MQIPVLAMFLKVGGCDESKKEGEVLYCEEGFIYLIHVLPLQREKGKAQKIIDCHQVCATILTKAGRFAVDLLLIYIVMVFSFTGGGKLLSF